MKKTLALILAAMMVAGTASVAFATHKEDLSVDCYQPLLCMEIFRWLLL